MAISDNIKRFRKRNHLTIRALAEKIGVDFSTVSHWETGYSEPRAKHRKRLIDIFDITESELFK